MRSRRQVRGSVTPLLVADKVVTIKLPFREAFLAAYDAAWRDRRINSLSDVGRKLGYLSVNQVRAWRDGRSTPPPDRWEAIATLFSRELPIETIRKTVAEQESTVSRIRRGFNESRRRVSERRGVDRVGDRHRLPEIAGGSQDLVYPEKPAGTEVGTEVAA